MTKLSKIEARLSEQAGSPSLTNALKVVNSVCQNKLKQSTSNSANVLRASAISSISGTDIFKALNSSGNAIATVTDLTKQGDSITFRMYLRGDNTTYAVRVNSDSSVQITYN